MEGTDQEPIPIWDRFPALERIAINFTLTCNLSCAHCIVESSPHRKERLSLPEVRTALLAGRDDGKKHVTFSGGEVFLFAKEVCELVAFARDLGYAVDVETNAYWARDEKTARARLAPFVEAGISGMALSADAYHAEHFPVDRTIQAAKTGREYGLLVEINFCPSQNAAVDAEIRAALEAAGEPYIENELLNRGRGAGLLQLSRRHAYSELPNCDSLTTTLHATGDMYACCELDISTDAMKRTPVFLGSIRNGAEPPEMSRKERLVRAFHDPNSPIYFRSLVGTHPAFRELADERFQSICHFCLHTLGDPRRVTALTEALASAEGEQ